MHCVNGSGVLLNMNFVAPIINFIIDLLVDIITFITGLLPQTPFNFQPVEWGVFGHAVGYFIPVGDMITHLALILTAVGLWYVVRWLLRLIRMIQ